jgi:putative tricarboxylic transport membrane protein
MWIAEFIAAVVGVLLGITVIFLASQLPYMSEYGPGPGFLPLWVGGGILACGIVIFIQVLKKYGKAANFFKPGTKMGVKILIEIIITFLLFPLIGFSVALGLFTGVAMRTMGKHKWVSCGLTSLVTAISVHFLFGHYLTIPLPTGIIGF